MSEYSILECDACGEEIRERGAHRVNPRRGWTRDDEGDLCPKCSARPEAAGPAATGE